MAININYSGRLGNNLFQYVFARLLAAQSGMHLATPFPYQHFLKTTPCTPGAVHERPRRTIREKNVPLIVAGNQVLDSAALRARRAETPDHYNLSGILDQPLEPGRYTLIGNFERSDFYNPREAQIKSFFDLEPLAKNQEDLVMNVRMGDFAEWDLLLHPQWYLSILGQEQFRRLYIVGARPDEPYLKYFAHYDPVVIPADPVGNFHFIRTFDRIVCSNSTYCWWAAFLSEASRIYTSDKWISALLYSCKDSIVVEAECLKHYTSTTQYGSVTYLQGFRAVVKELLDNFVIPVREQTQGAVTGMVNLLSSCIRTVSRAGGDYRATIIIEGAGRYELNCSKGTWRLADAEGTQADCRLVFPDAGTFLQALSVEDFFMQALFSGSVGAAGDINYFLSHLDQARLKARLDHSAEAPDQPVHPKYRYVAEPRLLRQVGHCLREGARVGWFQEREAYGSEGLGDLWTLAYAAGADGRKAKGDHFPSAPGATEVAVGPAGEPVENALPEGEAGADGGDDSAARPPCRNKYHKLLQTLQGRGRVESELLNAAVGAEAARGTTLKQALHLFYRSRLDYLVLDNFVVQRQ